ncbi:MAG: carbohydrate binding domain-containing protein, partial [Lentimicrobiaceae bacterium]|nr:carbohydrate binding domain-containing protein [Lentimicrobiaceae bacterium]
MKKLFIISTFFLHCSFFIIHCSAQPYTAYYNDFENWTDGTPNGIKPLTNPNAQYSQYTPAYSGTYSCKIESSTTNQAAFRIETTIPFPIYWGKKYILSFAAKRLTGEFDLFVKIDEANSSNNGGGLFFTKIVELGSEWKLYEFEFTSKSHHSSIEGNRILITAAFPYPAGDSFAYAIDELKITTFDDHTMEFDYLDINNIKSYIDPIATFQQNTIGVSAEPAFDINYFEVPKNSGKSTIFTSKLWLAGKDNEDQLAVAANKFNQGTEQGAENTDYWVGPISEDYKTVTDTSWYGMNGNQMLVSEIKQFSDTYIQKYHHTFKVSKEEINYHRAHFADSGYEMPWTIKNWPAHGRTEFGESANLAPFMNVAGDASYNPELGDYPRIRGDQAVFFITNDMGGLHTESGSQKAIGAEILGMAYAFNSPDSALQNTIFFTFDIKNKSNTDYHDFYAGFFNDF